MSTTSYTRTEESISNSKAALAASSGEAAEYLSELRYWGFTSTLAARMQVTLKSMFLPEVL